MASTRLKRGIEPLIAAVIVTAVGIAIAVAVSMWMLGVIGQTGYGTRPVELNVYGGMEAMGSEEAGQFKILVKNLGGDPIRIDDIIVDGKCSAMVFSAKTVNGENRMEKADDSVLVYIGPGESVYIWAVTEGLELKPGSHHEIKLHTVTGQEFYSAVAVSYVSMEVSCQKAYNLGVMRGDGKYAGVLKANVRNTMGEAFTNGMIELYVWGEPTPIYQASLKPEFQTLNAGEEKTIIAYFGIPTDKADEALIAKLTYETSRGTVEFAFPLAKPEPIKVYILYLDGAPAAWINPTKLYNKVKEVVGEENTIMLMTVDDLVDFFNDPPEKAIIINCHGESWPSPDKDHDSWSIYDSGHTWTGDPSIHDPSVPIYIPTGWQNWYTYTRQKISEKGLIFVNPIGYLGWYLVTVPDNTDPAQSHYDWRPQVVNTDSCCGANGRFHRDGRWTSTTIQGNGIKTVLDNNNVAVGGEWTGGGCSPHEVQGWAVEVSDVISDVEAMFAIDLPHNVSDMDLTSDRNNWRAVSYHAEFQIPVDIYGRKLWFYNFTTNPCLPYASAVYRVGNGFVVDNGWPWVGTINLDDPSVPETSDEQEEFVADCAVYFSVYTYVKAYIVNDI